MRSGGGVTRLAEVGQWVRVHGERRPVPVDKPGGRAVPGVPSSPREPGPAWARPDARRCLQLILATLWLLDGILQMQDYFFTKAFGTQMIAMSAIGNPSPIARVIHWSGYTIGHHPVAINALFAAVQVAIGLGIAWRRTARAALGASVLWSLAVWCVGEGFGGVFAGTADPVTGAPGAVLLYGLLAVLLWPTDRPGPRPAFTAARAVGARAADVVWLVLWGSLAYFMLVGSNRAPRGLHVLILDQATGEPAWVVRLDRRVAVMVDHRGLAVAIVVALVLALTGVGILLPGRLANAAVAVGMTAGLVFWVVGQDFGALLTNGATDVNSGPLLMLVALTYWRREESGESVGPRWPARPSVREPCPVPPG